MGNMLNHPFNSKHSLGPSEPAESSGRLRVGSQPLGPYPYCRNEIGVVCVQHCSVGYRKGQIARPPAPDELFEFDSEDSAAGVDSRLVVDPEIMALACRDEVVIAIKAHSARLAGQRGRRSASAGDRVGLAFLSAKPAAHPSDLDTHRIHRSTDGVGDLVLDFGGMLG